MQQAAHDPHLRLSLPVRRFLDPSNYAADFVGDALKGVHMFFRSEPSWEIIEVLYGMGWRMRKSHVIVEYVSGRLHRWKQRLRGGGTSPREGALAQRVLPIDANLLSLSTRSNKGYTSQGVTGTQLMSWVSPLIASFFCRRSSCDALQRSLPTNPPSYFTF